jgi:hypothetical protein
LTRSLLSCLPACWSSATKARDEQVLLVSILTVLPAKLRVLLSDDEEADPRELADKDDHLWAMQAHRQVNSVAAIALGGQQGAAWLRWWILKQGRGQKLRSMYR